MDSIKDWMSQTEFVIHSKMDIPMPEAVGIIALYNASNGEEEPKQFLIAEIQTLQNDGTYKKSTIEMEIPK